MDHSSSRGCSLILWIRTVSNSATSTLSLASESKTFLGKGLVILGSKFVETKERRAGWMVLARARCSNWPALPHGQLRPVLSPETIASQTCRVCADPLTGVQDLLVGEQLCHKFVAYKESVHLKQRHHMPGRHVASRLLPGSMSIGGN